MSGKKRIPCRVCGKLFEPCGYCQSHADIFRWRNFACSIECAQKYINDTIVYRESLSKKKIRDDNSENYPGTVNENITKKSTIKRKSGKKTTSEIPEKKIEIEDKET